MYYEHFHLTGPPFQAASPNSALFLSPTHREGLATLEWGLSRELNGFTLLTGEAGTGKTTLIYSMLQRDFKQVRIAYIADPKLSFLEIMRVILDQLNLYCTGTTKLDYLEALDRFLKLRNKEERVAIIVDESQVVSDDVLEELRLLSNHGQRHDRCLQLILVGQPELVGRLKKPELRQLDQRISARGVLSPLDPREALKYVDYRLRAQGGESARIFEPGALERLIEHSDGIPRRINVLCHNAMLLAYSARAKKVDLKAVMTTVAEYDVSLPVTSQISGWFHMPENPALMVGAALASLLLGFLYLHSSSKQAGQRAVSSGRALEQTAGQAQPVKQPNVEAYADPVVMPRAVALLASPPAAAAPALAGAPPEAPHGADLGLAAARDMRIAPAPPAAVAISGRAQQNAVAPAPVKQRRQIIVRYGDTIEKLSIRYFGSKSGINDLIDANPQLSDINRLSIGQIIYLPSISAPGIPSKAAHDQTAQTATAQAIPNAVDSRRDK